MLWRTKDHYGTQINEAIRFIATVAGEDDILRIKDGSTVSYRKFLFPLLPTAPHLVQAEGNGNETFRISTGPVERTDEFAILFASPMVTVEERRSRHKGSLPLRFGFSSDEKNQMLMFARDALSRYLEHAGKKGPLPPATMSLKRNVSTSVGVALWVDGAIRGSQVTMAEKMTEAIENSMQRAMTDPRWKPILPEELERTRIELTILSPITIPLSKKERDANEIYPEKGYIIRHDAQMGMFLPEVFNVKEFGTLAQLIGSLGQEKAGLDHKQTGKSEVSMFEVADFIESKDHAHALPLSGPVVHHEITRTPETLRSIGNSAADFLLRNQREDGSILPIMPIHKEASTRVDLVRLAFTANALAHYGKSVGNTAYIACARKSFTYIMKELDGRPNDGEQRTMLLLSYAGQLAFTLGEHDVGKTLGEEIEGILSDESRAHDPISISQAISFLRSLDRKGGASDLITRHLGSLHQRFHNERKHSAPSLAMWAELVPASRGIADTMGDEVRDWLLSQQRHDGSFPDRPGSEFTYTRGVGKIFEALAHERPVPEESRWRTINWLRDMQYDSENSFFIPDNSAQKVIGGFRHDGQRPDVWIDASGHVLLGLARLIS